MTTEQLSAATLLEDNDGVVNPNTSGDADTGRSGTNTPGGNNWNGYKQTY
jgi:hypothetical protein